MSRIDPERERQRLADYYASLTNEELEHLAEEAGELTEIAQGALRNEMAQRPLEFSLKKPAAAAEQELAEPVALRRYGDRHEAVTAESLLTEAGIPCFLADENMVRRDGFFSDAPGAVTLWVQRADAGAAAAVLDGSRPGSLEEEAEEIYRCPYCQSDDLTFEGNPDGSTDANPEESPLVEQHPRKWYCNACGKEWEESNSDSAASE